MLSSVDNAAKHFTKSACVLADEAPDLWDLDVSDDYRTNLLVHELLHRHRKPTFAYALTTAAKKTWTGWKRLLNSL